MERAIVAVTFPDVFTTY
ncbi:hypothetical protein [Agrobacterium rubi]